MLFVFQLLFVLFCLNAIFGVFQKYNRGLLGPKGMFFWVLFWVAVIGAILWPEGTAKIAGIFGIGRGADFVLYISIAVLFYLVFKLHIKIESMSRDVTKVVRDRALEEHRK